MNLLNQFWAARKVYEPCGMFTIEHMVLLALFMVILTALLFMSKKITNNQINKMTRILAVIVTILEVVKIGFNFYSGYTWINAWFPIAYCSIFIYSLWLSGYGKGKLKEMGDIFIAGATIIAGATYLLVPSTALTIYPMWHYLSLYSMLFHTLMVYIGIIYLCKLEIKLDLKNYIKYVKFYVFFAMIAIILNTLFESNLMMLRDPASIPLPVLKNLYNYSPWGYTTLVFMVYLFGPYGVTVYLNRIISKVQHKKYLKELDSIITLSN